eukprot:CAMPEP_0182618366 /NCGR_PEP_ID=MMETSP1330-20130603/45529_1 /TAXON_ID=464278 /ORGANISM="Picochlorum sp., Strain RCC944" /LENGTH=40 /DNA_ID= /DNA_START= /DNA_END= /DNA_ORIENTATION=
MPGGSTWLPDSSMPSFCAINATMCTAEAFPLVEEKLQMAI